MTQKTRRQLLVLGALALVVAVVGYVNSRGAAPTGAAPAPSNRPGARPDKKPEPPVVDVKLELLHTEHDPLEAPERNLFRFKPKPPPPPPPRPVAAPLKPGEIAPGVPAPVPMPMPSGPPPPPPIALKFIGILDAPGRSLKVAVLSDTRGNVFHGKEGDIIEGRYKLLKIGVESVEMSYVDGRGRQTIRLTGQ
jgi:hypothetical protein